MISKNWQERGPRLLDKFWMIFPVFITFVYYYENLNDLHEIQQINGKILFWLHPEWYRKKFWKFFCYITSTKFPVDFADTCQKQKPNKYINHLQSGILMDFKNALINLSIFKDINSCQTYLSINTLYYIYSHM